MNKNETSFADNLITLDIIDASFLSLTEIYEQPVYHEQLLDSAEVDSFDNISFPVAFFNEHKQEIFNQWEAAFANGLIWEAEAHDFMVNHEEVQSYYQDAVELRDKSLNGSSLEKVLAEFDTWTGTPMDIISTYGDIDFGFNIFAENFAMDVPVKIYSEADDVVFKFEAPWMKIDTFQDVELYPSRLNLKSVLSMLPVKINSQEIKASFVDGQFRLEVPKKEIALHQKSNQV